jgi:hypothetical protein
MEAIKKRLKATALSLSVLLLFQSCVVYHKTPTTLQNASQIQTKTKITKTTGETIIYKYITFQDGQFYGVKLKSGGWVKSPLDQNEINQVLTQNKSGSTWATIALITIPIIAIIVAVGIAMEDAFDFSYTGDSIH